MKCSFCGITKSELDRSNKPAYLVEGPKVNICLACVMECQRRIEKQVVERAVENIRRAVFDEFWEGA